MITNSKTLIRSIVLVTALSFGGASAFAATDTASVPAATKTEQTAKTTKTAKAHKTSHKQTASVAKTPAKTDTAMPGGK